MGRPRVAVWILLSAPLLVPLEGSGVEHQTADRSHVQIEIRTPTCLTSNTPFELLLEAFDGAGLAIPTFEESVGVRSSRHDLFVLSEDGSLKPVPLVRFAGGRAAVPDLVFSQSGPHRIEVQDGGRIHSVAVRVLPGAVSLLPPVLAIALALIFRQVVIALLCGIWLGASLLNGLDPFSGLLRALDTYLVDAVSDPSHAAIILFTLTLGGMVGILARSGGIRGMVEALSRYARTARSGQIATWAMGLLIFFDDYANTLLVGNTMRSVTDRLKISREKLSFIVDSTAAPVTSVAVISTWIGYELGLIADAFRWLGVEKNAYLVFVSTIPYRFYSLFVLVFVFLIAWTGRDFGGMLAAERRARRTGRVERDGAVPLAQADLKELATPGGRRCVWWNGLIPILTVIGVTMVGLYLNGRSTLEAGAGAGAGARLYEVIGAADSFSVLMWAAFAGAVIAGVLSITQRLLSLSQVVDAWVVGVRAMVVGIIILVCAWAIGRVCVDLKTGEWVFQATKDVLAPRFLPVLCFLVAGGVAFATGTSWGTMAILVPLVVPLAFRLSAEPGVQLGTIGAILAGSTFGDHCSPISDTTVMSSMASAADHVDHVRTQAPYALTCGAIACVLGYLPAGFGLPPAALIPVGIVLLVIVLRVFGRRVEAP